VKNGGHLPFDVQDGGQLISYDIDISDRRVRVGYSRPAADSNRAAMIGTPPKYSPSCPLWD
jgi:hypothetical protein